MTVLGVLLVDDDLESLRLLKESLPEEVGGAEIRWEGCETFEEAFKLIENRRYDVIVSDIYRDRTSVRKDLVTGDPQGRTVLDEIRARRFCPVLLFTDGTFPERIKEGPFLKLADKSMGNRQILEKLEELISTGIPELAHRLHDELDSASGSYLWTFLDENWVSLESGGLTTPTVLDRLIHRRAAVQFGRLQETANGVEERPTVEGAEFYLRPRIAQELRLGQIIERNGEYRVILTPHCHLVVQPGQGAPRADYVLSAKTETAKSLFERTPLKGRNDAEKADDLRRRIQSPAGFGRPSGRYWFLPGFLSMPHLYVDLLQLESLDIKAVLEDWETFAVLDVPFAEALQSSFVRFYSAVGLPMLDPARFAGIQLSVTTTLDRAPSGSLLDQGRSGSLEVGFPGA
jgi:CheY-like chemotaxis protein